ncbi:MAG: hypothetical protein Q4B31_00925 [Clostridia bacterium]|nr:hypothetical protein [Clostridia bacterium]
MKKTVKAGFGGFLCAIGMLILSLVLGEIAAYILKGTAFGGIFTFIFAGISVFLLYRHYAPEFTYEILEDSLKITRKTGRKIVEEMVAFSDIEYVGKVRKTKETKRFVKNILLKKDRVFIEARGIGYLTDAGEEFLIKLKELTNA